jgi:hypothetical protein
MAINPNGTIITALNANDLLERSNQMDNKFMSSILENNLESLNEDSISIIYKEFLDEAVKLK